jgi:hypothetical protein
MDTALTLIAFGILIATGLLLLITEGADRRHEYLEEGEE